MTFKEKLELEKERKKQRYINSQPLIPKPVKQVVIWGIVLYTGKILYDWWNSKKNKSKLKKVENALGKKCKFMLDLYVNERDAKILESVVTRFNEVLSSKRPLSIVNDPEEYEAYYRAGKWAIERSSPSPERDMEYLDMCIEYVKNLEKE